jgi:uncharacterized protein involved in type VI secretion and phage assembly
MRSGGGVIDENPVEAMIDDRVPRGFGGHFYGVCPGVVTDIKDPDGQGRVKVKLPWAKDTNSDAYEAWARLATLMGGNNRGSWFIPHTGDEVLLAFEHGDVRRPYVLGGLWNGKDTPPASMDGSGNNYKKVLCSKNGVKITLDDTDGQETLTLETPGGQKVTLQDGANQVEIQDSNGNSLTLASSGVTIKASSSLTIDATSVEVTAGSVTVNAGMSQFNGAVQADTVIASSVVGTSYTPGAGNVW